MRFRLMKVQLMGGSLAISGLFAVLLTACRGDGSDTPSAINEAEELVLASLVEELRIDGHAAGLVPIQGLLVGTDGTVVIGQPQEMTIRFFSPDGDDLGRFGARGQGPGEFASIFNMGWVGDSVWVWDQFQSRITVISPEQELSRTFSVPRQPRSTSPDLSGLPQGVLLWPEGLRSDGRLYVGFGIPSGVFMPDHLADRSLIALASPDGTVEGLVASVPRGAALVRIATGSTSIPFPNRGPVAVASDASRIAGAFTSLEGDDYEAFSVTVWDLDGSTVFARRFPFERIPIPSTVADSVFSERLAGLPPALADAFRREVEIPAIYPPLAGVVIGRDGSVWIEKVVREETRPYLALDRNGNLLGSVLLSLHERIVAADVEHVWVLERDAFDVESILRYRVSWH